MPSQTVSVDAATPGTILRYAFATEAGLNIIAGLAMMFYPKNMLDLMVSHPSTTNTSSTNLIQWLGCLSNALAVPLLMGLPNTRQAIESRRVTYWTLLVGEALLVPVVLYQATGPGVGGTGFTRKAFLMGAQILGPPALWRLYCLFGKPELFGRYRDEKMQ